jgi:non-ribosomal peptide synthetase-like protein
MKSSLFLILLSASVFALHVPSQQRTQSQQLLQPDFDAKAYTDILLQPGQDVEEVISKFPLFNEPTEEDESHPALNNVDLLDVGTFSEGANFDGAAPESFPTVHFEDVSHTEGKMPMMKPQHLAGWLENYGSELFYGLLGLFSFFVAFVIFDMNQRRVVKAEESVSWLLGKTLPQIFERTAYMFPNKIAVEVAEDGIFLSYRELNMYAEHLQIHLQAQIGRPDLEGGLVAIYMPRCPGIYVAQQGILKSGAGFVPIDDSFPLGRVEFTLNDSGAAAVITTPELAAALRHYSPGIDQKLVILEIAPNDLIFGQLPRYKQASVVKPKPVLNDTAYIIYTSGTTGNPKGVVMSHTNAATFIRGMADGYGLQSSDRVLQGFSTAFDASVEEVWAALAFGGTLLPVPKSCMTAFDEIPMLLQRLRVTVFSAVPTLLSAVAASQPDAIELPKLRILISGGEALKASTVKLWQRPHRVFLNTYGPTECAVVATLSKATATEEITIGKALLGYTTYVLSVPEEGEENNLPLEIVKDGEQGELCIGGPAVSHVGYNNLQQKTADAFRTLMPGGSKIYRTGDLVRVDPATKNIIYLGRIDTQVKIRGYRVELSEIERRLAQVPLISDAVVLQKGTNKEALVAYCIVDDLLIGQFDPEVVKAALKQHLASYMIPTHFLAIMSSVVDRQVSGKIDRKRLPWPLPSVEEQQADIQRILHKRRLAMQVDEIADALQSVDANILKTPSLDSKPKGASAPAAAIEAQVFEDPDPVLVHHLFERSVRHFPHNTALEVPASLDGFRPAQTFTYAELNFMANELAVQLRNEFGDAKNPVVPLFLPREDPLLYIGMLAIMKAGGAYTVLEPTLPTANLEFILGDCKPKAVVTGTRYAAALADFAQDFAVLDANSVRDATFRTDRISELPDYGIDKNDCAYVIYTSGTTGKPKGCLVEHDGVVTLMEYNRERFALTQRDRCAQNASTTFDASVEEIHGAWGSGGCLVVLTEEIKQLGPDLIAMLARLRISFWCPCPTMLRMTECQNPDELLPDLRVLYPGGEALTKDVASTWGKGRHLENGYGPTEATCVCMTGRVYVDDEGNVDGEITIGGPTRGQTALVMTDATGELKEVPFGEEGELVIVGNQVARGYLNRPELTAEKFVMIEGHGRGYRTGDLVRQLPDERFVCLGRIDAQVKLHGHRIELESIESILCSHPMVKTAACDVQKVRDTPRMVAFVVLNDASDLGNDTSESTHRAALLEFLGGELPHHHVPSFIVFVDHLEHLVSGKINRKHLKLIEWSTSGPVDDKKSEDDDSEKSSNADTSSDHSDDDSETLSSKNSDSSSEKASDEGQGDEETIIANAFCEILGVTSLKPHSDFFEVGGNSLLASQVISILRKDKKTAGLVVRDIYNLRTISALATKVVESQHSDSADNQKDGAVGLFGQPRKISAGNLEASDNYCRRFWCTVAQFFSLLIPAFIFSITTFIVIALTLPIFTLYDFDYKTVLWVFPMIAGFFYFLGWVTFFLTLGYTLALKWLLVGTVRPGKHKVWGYFYFRMWIIRMFLTAVPTGMLEGTAFKNCILRLLGAKIGDKVHIHKDSFPMNGAWDLLEIGDNVSIGPMTVMKMVDHSGGYQHLAPITIGKDVSINLGGVIKGNSFIADGCYLDYFTTVDCHHVTQPYTKLSGTPMKVCGEAPPSQEDELVDQGWSPYKHGVIMISLSFASFLFEMTIGCAIMSFFMWQLDCTYFDMVILLYGNGITKFYGMTWPTGFVFRFILVVCIMAILNIIWTGIKCKYFWPRVKPGVYSRFGLWYSLMTWKVQAVGSVRSILSGSMFYGYWLSLAGAEIKEYCEISEIFDVVPELLCIKGHTWTSSVVFFDTPRIHRSCAFAAKTEIGNNCYFGNYACIPPGSYVPPETLIGIATIVPPGLTDADIGRSWFGRPAFELPQREVFNDQDPRMTGDAKPYLSCLIARYIWEFSRLLIVAGMDLLTMFTMYTQVYFCGAGPEPAITEFIRSTGFPVPPIPKAFGAKSLTGIYETYSARCLLGFVPAFGLLHVTITMVASLIVKWFLLGKVRKGISPLWASWPARWDFTFVFWERVNNAASRFEGTLLMGIWLRLNGVTVGKNVLFTSGGSQQLSEPDLTHVGDHCIVDGNPWQTHTFEDGVLKRDTLFIGDNCRLEENCLVLYGAKFNEGSVGYANSSIMKDEFLAKYTAYAGCPVVPQPWTVAAGESFLHAPEELMPRRKCVE